MATRVLQPSSNSVFATSSKSWPAKTKKYLQLVSFSKSSFVGNGIAMKQMKITSRNAPKKITYIRAISEESASSSIEEDISKTYLPAAQFYKIEAIIRPWRLTYAAKSLLRMGIRGVTVSDVRGFGAQGGSRERQAGSEFTDDKLVSKVKVEVVVVYEQVEEVVNCIIEEARTGEIGDGKIFISPVSDIIRVRTGERGIKAERMAGGRVELLSKVS